jgi:ABC-type Na+ efflux pump permease subunit
MRVGRGPNRVTPHLIALLLLVLLLLVLLLLVLLLLVLSSSAGSPAQPIRRTT